MDETRDVLRRQLEHYNRALVASGLNSGTAGNVSVRHGHGMLITPSGLLPADTTADMMAFLALDAPERWDGLYRPSSEWRLHRDILVARPDVQAVVHTHSPYATVLATQHREIPALHYMIAAFGGPRIACTPYVPFGTQELSDLIIEHMGPRHGVLLGNHGMVAVGATLQQAAWRAEELENLSRLFVISSATGTPVILSDEEIERTIERFADYGLAKRSE